MKKLILLGLVLLLSTMSFAQVGIGTKTPAPSSLLELKSENKALLVTRVASEESIENPVDGMIIYDIALGCIRSYQKGVWSNCNSITPPFILTLECASALPAGTLTAGTVASGVTVTVPYTGGNAGIYAGEIVSSTGVTGLSATLQPGTLATGDGNVIYTISGTPGASGTASFSINLAGETCTIEVPVVAGGPIVSGLTCASATVTGSLTANTSASGVFISVPYTGGNGNAYSSQVITSTGVTGLTAFLNSGTLSNGAGGNLLFSISGTPTSSGVASFAFTFGGQTCSFTANVAVQPAVATISNCNVSSTGTLTQGQAASGVSQTISYTGGNGANYTARSFASSGVFGLTATLSAGALANGNGNLVLNITGTPTSSGTATFNISLFGGTCSFTRTVNPATATATLNCAGATFNPTTITQGTAYNGTITVPYTGGNSVAYGAGVGIASTGVTGLTATLQAGTLGTTGNLTYTVTGTASSTGTANFFLTFGSSSCTVGATVAGATVGGLTCGSAVFNPVAMTQGTAYSGTFTLPYTGGNGAPYPAGTAINSTGVTGLTATLQAGTLTSGSGNLTFTVTGTPTSSGTATFPITFGGQSCNVTKAVSGFPAIITTTTSNIGNAGHFQPSSFPVLYDDRVTYTTQDQVFGDMRDLRLHQDGKDIIRTTFNTAIPAGGKIRISWSRIEKPNGLGLIVELRNGANLSQAIVNTLSNVFPNATQTASGNDMTLTINLIAPANISVIKSSQDNDGKDPILMEIEVFDNNNVKIPVN